MREGEHRWEVKPTPLVKWLKSSHRALSCSSSTWALSTILKNKSWTYWCLGKVQHPNWSLKKWTWHREAKCWFLYIALCVTCVRIKSPLSTHVQTMIICFKHWSLKGFIDSLINELQRKLGDSRNLEHNEQNCKKESESSVSKDKSTHTGTKHVYF